MVLKEVRAFVEDPMQEMSAEEKNLYLSARLVQVPYSTMSIVRIDRMETAAKGWWITYMSKNGA
jgi:hypothetical protein